VLGLKGNQETLFKAVKAHVEEHASDDFARKPVKKSAP
jgi:hypothetical protein